MCRPRSFRKAVIAIEEILASRGIRSGYHLCGGGCSHGRKQRPTGFPVWRRLDWHKPYCCVAMSGKDDIVARLGSPNKLR